MCKPGSKIYHPVFEKEAEKSMFSRIYEYADENYTILGSYDFQIAQDEMKFIPRVMKFDRTEGKWVTLEALRIDANESSDFL